MNVLQRYSWTVFVLLSVILLLIGISDLPGATTSVERENAINELFIGCLSAAIALVGLRRRQRWAWWAMGLWPVWIAAQALRAGTSGKTDEMATAVFLLVITLVALALSYRADLPHQARASMSEHSSSNGNWFFLHQLSRLAQVAYRHEAVNGRNPLEVVGRRR